MIAGLASRLPGTLSSGLRQHGVDPAVAHQIAALPPVSSLFAAVLGVNPLGHLLAARGALTALPAAARQTLTGREFFPGAARPAAARPQDAQAPESGLTFQRLEGAESSA